MRQYRRFHSRALVSVLAPNEKYFGSSSEEVADGRESTPAGRARKRCGTCCATDRGIGKRNRRSRRSLLNKAIR